VSLHAQDNTEWWWTLRQTGRQHKNFKIKKHTQEKPERPASRMQSRRGCLSHPSNRSIKGASAPKLAKPGSPWWNKCRGRKGKKQHQKNPQVKEKGPQFTRGRAERPPHTPYQTSSPSTPPGVSITTEKGPPRTVQFAHRDEVSRSLKWEGTALNEKWDHFSPGSTLLENEKKQKKRINRKN